MKLNLNYCGSRDITPLLNITLGFVRKDRDNHKATASEYLIHGPKQDWGLSQNSPTILVLRICALLGYDAA